MATTDVRYWEAELRNRTSVARLAEQNVATARRELKRLEADERSAKSQLAEAQRSLQQAKDAERRR